MRGISVLIFSFLLCFPFLAESTPAVSQGNSVPIKLGYIGSLTGFASSYGRAVLDGVELAVTEINASGHSIDLVVEDDLSEMKNTVTAARKLLNVDRVQAIIAGTWWATSLPPVLSAHENVPLLSCETTFDKDTLPAKNYFIMLGHLKSWVTAFQPLLKDRDLTRGSAIHFTSGFGQTLSDATRGMFSQPGRDFVDELTYTSVDAADASSLLLRLKSRAPDTLYIDGQPSSLASMLKKIRELHLNLTVLTSVIARDAFEQKLISPPLTDNLYFSQRARISREFDEKFRRHFGHDAALQSDLGYYSARLLVMGLKNGNPVGSIKNSHHSIDGIKFTFDNQNVLQGLSQEIWGFRDGLPRRLY